MEERVAGEVPFCYLKFSLLLLRSKYVGRGCSGADTEFAGKWSAFAERADFVTGQRRCWCAPGLPVLEETLSSHVGGMGDAKSHLRGALSHGHPASFMASVSLVQNAGPSVCFFSFSLTFI